MPTAEVCITLCQRYYRLPFILRQLEKQSVQNFNVNIWNNSGKDLEPLLEGETFPKERLKIHNSDINIGSKARFKLVSKTEGNPIIFMDDDEDIADKTIEYFLTLWKQTKDTAIWGWYTRTFVNEMYHPSYDNPPIGSEVDYIGTGGMVLDRKIFDEEPILQDIPRPFDKTEDLFLCHIARKRGIKLLKAEKGFSIRVDGKDQYIRYDKNDIYKRLRDGGFETLIDMQKKEWVFQNLKDLKEVFDELKIPFWLSDGLLLGLYRDGDIIRGDEDDTDICVWNKYADKIPEALEKLKEKGFKQLDEWRFKDDKIEGVPIGRGTNKIDIIMVRKKGKDKDKVAYFLARNFSNFGKLPYFAFVFPYQVFKEMSEIEWRGIRWACPKDIEGYLTARYGDWKTPIRRGEGYNPLDLKTNPCLRKNWEYDNPKHLLQRYCERCGQEI